MDILTLKKIDTHVRYFIRLSYRGANYHGWQSQPNAITVQQAIEQALSTVLRAPIAITGAGRTDTGVNAAMMIAHFDYHEMLPTAYMQRITRSLNGLLGRDIAIQAIFPVHDDAHADDRVSALEVLLAHEGGRDVRSGRHHHHALAITLGPVQVAAKVHGAGGAGKADARAHGATPSLPGDGSADRARWM